MFEKNRLMKIGQCYVFNPPSSTCSVDLKAKIVHMNVEFVQLHGLFMNNQKELTIVHLK